MCETKLVIQTWGDFTELLFILCIWPGDEEHISLRECVYMQVLVVAHSHLPTFQMFFALQVSRFSRFMTKFNTISYSVFKPLHMTRMSMN